MSEADDSGRVDTIVSRGQGSGARVQGSGSDRSQIAAAERRSATLLPPRFYLQIDGVGSVLVVRDATVTVGPISSSRRPMVGLVADPTIPVITISRQDDDYFLAADGPMHVNGDATTSRLLADNDKIALSPRCRLKFRLPNAASTTAVLDLSAGGAKLPRGDVQRIVLMDGALIIGPAASAHVRTSAVDEPIVLQIRDSELTCRAKQNVTVNDKAVSDDAPLPIGAHVRIGDLGMVVTEA
jgi:hypothetical protein